MKKSISCLFFLLTIASTSFAEELVDDFLSPQKTTLFKELVIEKIGEIKLKDGLLYKLKKTGDGTHFLLVPINKTFIKTRSHNGGGG
ncbi:MAG: hypothetical protein HOE90_09745 [Bacteriovoracaceae bacterium]|jgi:hypothetical protein|nr:hypothetical protein [Bacteriovoracaceae bacterium]